MLSSVDYELINNWMLREIPLELVLSGIRDAFSEKNQNEFESIRNIKSISGYIEKRIEQNKSFNKQSFEHQTIEKYNHITCLEILNKELERCKDQRVKKSIIELKQRLQLQICNSDTFEYNINSMEDELMDEIYNRLSEQEKLDLHNNIENLLSKYIDKYTQKAYQKSYKSHRNSLLKNKFSLDLFE